MMVTNEAHPRMMVTDEAHFSCQGYEKLRIRVRSLLGRDIFFVRRGATLAMQKKSIFLQHYRRLSFRVVAVVAVQVHNGTPHLA